MGCHKFPKDFIWGAACSAMQMEGAVLEDGKTYNVSDYNFYFPHPEAMPQDTRSPDVGIDYYHKFREDHTLFQQLGLKAFRFSISWCRICPDIDGKPNPLGIAYYNAVIDDMLSKGITPFFDLWHSDLPRWVVDNGGIVSDKFIGWFTHYAEICFKEFGDRVKFWNTVNEPKLNVYGAYSHAHSAPFLRDQALAMKATTNVILAHFEIVRLLKKMWPDAKIGSVHNIGVCYSMSFDKQDIEAANRHSAMQLLFLDPMMKGEFPAEVLAFPDSAKYILPEYMADIKEKFVPMDFYGVNYYTPCFIRSGNSTAYGTQWFESGLPKDAYGFINYASGMFDILMDLNDRYDGTPVFITENGYTYRREDVNSTNLEEFQYDDKRIDYIREHLRACSRLIRSGVNVKGYFYWSVMDCWEGTMGFGYPMGLIGVNLDTLERVPRESFHYYKKVIEANMVD